MILVGKIREKKEHRKKVGFFSTSLMTQWPRSSERERERGGRVARVVDSSDSEMQGRGSEKTSSVF